MTENLPENRIAELSPSAIEDLDRVVGTAIGVAREQLESVGAFLPFGIALQKPADPAASASEDDDAAPAGELRLLAVQPTEAEDDDADIDADEMLADLVALIRQQEETFLAVALVSDVTLLSEDRDAIHVNAEHREGGAAGVVSAYTPPADDSAAEDSAAGSWTFDDPQTETGVRLVWVD
ncbi:hypothetical protein ACXA45_08300 [Neomicrococcus lactis]